MRVIKPKPVVEFPEQTITCPACMAVLGVTYGDLQYCPPYITKEFYYITCPECGRDMEIKNLSPQVQTSVFRDWEKDPFYRKRRKNG